MRSRTLFQLFVGCMIVVMCGNLRAQVSGQVRITDTTRYIGVTQEPKELVPLESLIKYPDSARRNRIEGEVTVQALIGKDGHVLKVVLLKSSNPVFDQPAIDAMLAERFSPPMKAGTPLRVWLSRTVHFTLNAK